MDENAKIVKCNITDAKDIFDVPQVMIQLEGSKDLEQLFTYYPDEISFCATEFIGLTLGEAKGLKFRKDKAYLQS